MEDKNAYTEPKKLFNKNFVLMLQGNAVSLFGNFLYSIAIGYFVYHKTGSESLMGIFTSINLFISMFLSPIAGTIIDKINRKRVVVGMDAIRGVIMIGIGYFVIKNSLPISALIAITVVISIANVLFSPAASTIMLDIVAKKDFVQANSIVSAGTSVIELISNGISGFLLAYVGVGELIIFNGISFIISAITEYFIKVPKTPKQGQKINIKSTAKDLGTGLKTILTTKGLNSMFFIAFSINILISGIVNLFLILTTTKGFTIKEYGLFMSCMSCGGLIGAIIMSAWKIKPTRRHIIMSCGYMLTAVFAVCFIIAKSKILFAVFTFLMAMFNSIGNMLLISSFMILIPRDKRATIMGFMSLSSVGGVAISTLLYGFLAEKISIVYVGAVGATLSLIPMLYMARNKELKQIITSSSDSSSEDTENTESEDSKEYDAVNEKIDSTSEEKESVNEKIDNTNEVEEIINEEIDNTIKVNNAVSEEISDTNE